MNFIIASLTGLGVFVGWSMLGLPDSTPLVILDQALSIKLIVALAIGFHTFKKL